MSDYVEQATDIAVSLAKGAITLSLLEDLSELATAHDMRKHALDVQYRDGLASLNQRFVSDMLHCVTRARSALDDINDVHDNIAEDDD